MLTVSAAADRENGRICERAGMDAITAVLTRRSLRRGFTAQRVDGDVITRIVDCALHAPSSKDDQPWRIHAVTEPQFGEVIARAMESSPRIARYVPVDPITGTARSGYESSVIDSASVLRAATLWLVVENAGAFSGGRAALGRGAPGALAEALIGYSFEYLGIGAAIQNMWLAAHSLGLGGTFVGDALIVEDEIRAHLGIEGELAGILALGYTSAGPHAEKVVAPGRARLVP